MTHMSFSSGEEQVYLLDCIELLTLIFRGPAEGDCIGMVREGIPQLVSTTPASAPHLKAALQNLQACVSAPENGQADTGSLCDELEARYVSLFISHGTGVAAPLYESCHLTPGGSVMGDAALRMRNRLDEAGLAPAGASNEPPDHLCIELEYLYYVLSRAWNGDSGEPADAAFRFAREDMLPWVRTFAAAVAGADPDGFYQRASDLLVVTLESCASNQT